MFSVFLLLVDKIQQLATFKAEFLSSLEKFFHIHDCYQTGDTSDNRRNVGGLVVAGSKSDGVTL